MLARLGATQLVSAVKELRARKVHNDALAEICTRAKMQQARAFSDVLVELANLRQYLRSAQDRLSRAVIRRPLAGVIKALAEISSKGDDLVVEARVLPTGIAPLAVGQKATVKLSAYDYTQWGSLVGRVELISADSFKDERRPERPAHYKVFVSLDRSTLTVCQSGIDLRPGLQAVVELHTERKTVLT